MDLLKMFKVTAIAEDGSKKGIITPQKEKADKYFFDRLWDTPKGTKVTEEVEYIVSKEKK